VVQVVIDGALVNDGVQALENIPANSVEFIQILSGRESVLRYGSTGGNGVIIVKTTAG
jgi:outer membrane cobalamin receptor